MTNCTCEWTGDRMTLRHAECEQHGDGSLFWRRVQRRLARRMAAKG